jgi:hypothetical protein
MGRRTRHPDATRYRPPADAAAVIARHVLRGERILGCADASPISRPPATGRRSLGAVVVALGFGAVTDDVRGAADSSAMSLRRAVAGPVSVAITDRRVTFWTFYVGERRVAPIAVAAFARDQLRFIATTGATTAATTRATGDAGAPTRFSFVDESFIDLAVTAHAGFASAAASKIGANWRHGPHHDAQKSTNVMPSPFTVVSKLSMVSVLVATAFSSSAATPCCGDVVWNAGARARYSRGR